MPPGRLASQRAATVSRRLLAVSGWLSVLARVPAITTRYWPQANCDSEHGRLRVGEHTPSHPPGRSARPGTQEEPHVHTSRNPGRDPPTPEHPLGLRRGANCRPRHHGQRRNPHGRRSEPSSVRGAEHASRELHGAPLPRKRCIAERTHRPKHRRKHLLVCPTRPPLRRAPVEPEWIQKGPRAWGPFSIRAPTTAPSANEESPRIYPSRAQQEPRPTCVCRAVRGPGGGCVRIRQRC